MTQPNVDSLLARLEALEAQRDRASRRSRLWGSAALTALLASAGLFLIAPAQGQGQNVVKASSFVLTDANGKTRGELKIKDGGPHLAFFDGNDKPRMLLSLSDKGAATISIQNPEGKVRAVFGFKDDGETSAIALRDADGETRLGMTCSKKGVPGLIMGDGQDTRLSLGVSGKGAPSLAMKKPGGDHGIILSTVGDSGTPALLMYGPDGKVDKKLSLIGKSKK